MYIQKIWVHILFTLEELVRKPKITIKNGRFHTETVFDELVLRVIVAIIAPILLYLPLRLATIEPPSLRIAKIVIGTMLAIAPPVYWAAGAFGLCMIDVIKQIVRLIKGKKVGKSKGPDWLASSI